MSGTSRRHGVRRGFTLVELLVVIAIIGTLVGLLLPAINSARERSRQGSCTNNLKELGLAMTSYATAKGEFPGWLQLQKLDPTDPSAVDCYTGTANDIDVEMSWAAKLLPNLDQGALWESLLSNKVGPGQMLFGDVTGARPDELPQVEIFMCPSNPPTRATDSVLSYVANTGMPDLVSATNPSDYVANGVCHNRVTVMPDGPSTVNGPACRYPSDIKDGTNTTLLLSENVQKDESDPGSSARVSWLRSNFPFGAVGEQPFGMVWVYDNSSLPDSALNPGADYQMRINKVPDPPTNELYAEDGRFARPGSEHPELVIAVFAGGNTRSIREDIDYGVYQQLMTPNRGRIQLARFPGFDVQANLDMREAFDQAKPLSDADY